MADKQIGHDHNLASIIVDVDDIIDDVDDILDEVPDELYLPTSPKLPEYLRSVDVDDILDEVPDELYLPTIPKVPEHLRSVDVKAYEPEMIEIGAFTYELCSKIHLKLVEED